MELCLLLATVTVESPKDPYYPGDKVTLRCVIAEHTDWDQYNWYRDEVSIQNEESQQQSITISLPDQAGLYQYTCEGSSRNNPKTSQRSTPASITVKALPTATVTVVSPEDPYYPGDVVTLRCDIAEHTDWHGYYWYRNRYSIQNRRSRAITISLPDQAGLYQYTCEGSSRNSPKTSQRSTPASITVKAFPVPTLTVKPNPVFTGESVTLTCGIQPSTGWSYAWNNPPSSKASETNSNTLTISGAAVSDQGEYGCYGVRERSRKTSPYSTVQLTVKSLPTATVTEVSPEGPYYPGDEVTLRCDIAEYTDWYGYYWYRNRYSIQNRRSRAITISLPDQAGLYKYTCEGRSRNSPKTSQRSTPASITVKALPLATLTVDPQSPVFTGENVTLKCVIESLSGWTYKWYKESSRTPVSEGNTFTIRGAAESHKGQYWCQGERRHRPTSSQPSRRITLDVKDSKPKLTLSPGHHLLTGDSVTLKCELGVSSGLVFYWYRNTQASDPVAQTVGNSYSISSVKVSDGGQYWCRAGRGDPVFYTQYSGAAEITVTERLKPIITLKSNWTEFFNGEKVSLRCDFKSGKISDWKYSWFRDGKDDNSYRVHQPVEGYKVNPLKSGNYTCKGQRERDQKLSEESHAFAITIHSGKAQAVLNSLSQTWLTKGDSVTLSCEVRGSTEGWRFHWYKNAPYRPGFPQVFHESSGYYVELVSDSIRGAGGSYTLSPAALRHTGVYVCRAERGEPAYHTEFSQPQPLWLTGMSLASVIIHSNWTQIFTSEPLSLSCGVQGNSTGWRLRWFTGRGGESLCPTDWRSETGSNCSISSASQSDSGVYWCQSESGEQSNPVNITVHNEDVILESPAHPLTEGDPLTLRCRYRYQPSNISADFYKDGTLLQTSTTGEMTIPAVSKSHEGLYKCSNPERGESPESWITVNVAAPHSGSSLLVTVGVVVGLVLMIVLIIILVLLFHFKKLKGVIQTPPGQQQLNTSQNQDLSQSAGNEGDQTGYEPLHSGTTNVYDTVGTADQKEEGAATVGQSDVTYATIDQKSTCDKIKKKRTKNGGKPEPDIVYSELKAVKVTAKVNESQVDAVYSEVKHPTSSGV